MCFLMKKDLVLNIDRCIKYYQTYEYTLSFLILEICHKKKPQEVLFFKIDYVERGTSIFDNFEEYKTVRS